MEIVFVDSDNVSKCKVIEYIKQNLNKKYIFIGNEKSTILKKYPEIEYVKSTKTNRQSADHWISFLIGKYITIPNVSFRIISFDKGFQFLYDICNKYGIKLKITKFKNEPDIISSPKRILRLFIRYNIKQKLPPEKEKIFDFISNIYSIDKNGFEKSWDILAKSNIVNGNKINLNHPFLTSKEKFNTKYKNLKKI